MQNDSRIICDRKTAVFICEKRKVVLYMTEWEQVYLWEKKSNVICDRNICQKKDSSTDDIKSSLSVTVREQFYLWLWGSSFIYVNEGII